MAGWNGKIDRLNSLIELVRTTSTSARTDPNAKQSSSSGPGITRVKTHDMGELRRRIAAHLQHTHGETPLTSGQAGRTIMREILLWEFGPQLEQHAEFSVMLGTIEKTFEANPSLKAKMADLVEEFRQNPSRQ